jgi:hypothetical protein
MRIRLLQHRVPLFVRGSIVGRFLESRAFQRAGWVVILANLLFVLLVFTAPIDPQTVADRVRSGFASGDLVVDDYLTLDNRRGTHQYNDCLVLQMLSNPEPSRLQRALAPIIYKADPMFDASCPVLHAIVVQGQDRADLLSFRYTRYWHGDMVLAAWALEAMPLPALRILLTLTVTVAVVALAFVGVRAGGRVQLVALAISASAALIWAAPFFDPGLTHAPGDALALLILVPLARWRRIAMTTDLIVPYAAAAGAGLAFFEMFTGQLPTAAPWLAVMTLAAASDAERDRKRDSEPGLPSRPRYRALSAFVAFGLAAGLTVLVKQALGFALATPEAGALFMSQLIHYLNLPPPQGGTPVFLLPFTALIDSSMTLTYGSRSAGYGLLAAVAIVLLAAGVRAWRRRTTEDGRQALTIVALALVPIGWVLVFPGHTYFNAGIMVRMFVVPTSLAPLALIWPTLLARTPPIAQPESDAR